MEKQFADQATRDTFERLVDRLVHRVRAHFIHLVRKNYISEMASVDVISATAAAKLLQVSGVTAQQLQDAGLFIPPKLIKSALKKFSDYELMVRILSDKDETPESDDLLHISEVAIPDYVRDEASDLLYKMLMEYGVDNFLSKKLLPYLSVEQLYDIGQMIAECASSTVTEARFKSLVSFSESVQGHLLSAAISKLWAESSDVRNEFPALPNVGTTLNALLKTTISEHF